MDNEPKKIFDIRQRTLDFTVSILKLASLLPKNTAGFVIANQLIRSGSSVGANIEEAQDSASKKEFIHSMTISLKEARETQYWLNVIEAADLISDIKLVQALKEIQELVKILTTIVKKAKLK
ncbi:MAG: four helix bundle protein [Candidatus Daviesbacteria bacterium]|nr:four helix bundle protein [Candidatus Daviesbacteria bacterium]